MPKLIIGTGSRDYRTPTPIRSVFSSIFTEFGKDFIYFHGNQRGFDQYSDFVLRRMGFFHIRAFNAEWDLYGNSAGPIRNEQMLNTGLEIYPPHDILIIAMPLETSIGTWHMINYARSKGIETRIYNERGMLVNG